MLGAALPLFLRPRATLSVVDGSLEITPQAANGRLTVENKAILIDVREPAEWALARVEGAELIPMGSVPAQLQRIESLSDSGDLFVLCHHGVRSLQVVTWLRGHGVENCWSVAGGIERWRREVDESIPAY